MHPHFSCTALCTTLNTPAAAPAPSPPPPAPPPLLLTHSVHRFVHHALPTCGSASTSSQVGQYSRCGRAEMYFMYRRHLPHLDSGLPVRQDGVHHLTGMARRSIIWQGTNTYTGRGPTGARGACSARPTQCHNSYAVTNPLGPSAAPAPKATHRCWPGARMTPRTGSPCAPPGTRRTGTWRETAEEGIIRLSVTGFHTACYRRTAMVLHSHADANVWPK